MTDTVEGDEQSKCMGSEENWQQFNNGIDNSNNFGINEKQVPRTYGQNQHPDYNKKNEFKENYIELGRPTELKEKNRMVRVGLMEEMDGPEKNFLNVEIKTLNSGLGPGEKKNPTEPYFLISTEADTNGREEINEEEKREAEKKNPIKLKIRRKENLDQRWFQRE
ncbi:hypothetical protein L6452_33984 [Arctium lappa]|uniref:Uncharacterized protein n=1 Tax=Arctium lappa TaxID=4217 RepID=A0ACB8YHI9_ARCLA|nr:hypothetical protein L6452_33984 [Arctium lappa]